jgi:hypothetical protein
MHPYGRSFRFDFPISCKREEGVVGVAALLMMKDERVPSDFVFPNDSTAGNVSITTDGEVVAPSVPLVFADFNNVPLSKIMQPLDYVKLGNKLSVVIEESNDFFDGVPFSFEIQIFMKTKRL